MSLFDSEDDSCFGMGLVDFPTFSSSSTMDLTDVNLVTNDLGDGINMSLSFANNNKLRTYIICDDGDVVKNNIATLTNANLYDTPENALHYTKDQNLFKQRSLVTCILDLTTCLDLLDIKTMKKLYDFYKQGVVAKKFNKTSTDNEILTAFIKKYNYKSVRSVFSTDKKFNSKSILLVEKYTQYKILDVSCLEFSSTR